MSKADFFLFCSAGFLSGVFLASWFSAGIFWILGLLIAAAIIFTAAPKSRFARAAALILLCGSLGIWRTWASLEVLARENLDGHWIEQKAVVVKEPERKDNYQNITAILASGQKVLLRTSTLAELEYGDEIRIQCELKIPEKRNDFDYRLYLAKDKIYYICQKANYEKTGRKSANMFYLALLRAKKLLAGKNEKLIPYPESTLGNGLIFGGSSDLPKPLRENFSRTGLSHIVAVSGYNVTIIAEYLIILGIFIGFWRKQAFWFAVFGIIFFVAMIGFPASAVRAGIMGSLLLWAMKNGRLANSWNAILLAAAVMLAANPLLLRWDVSFQLSFLATIGIVSFAPVWEKNLIKKNRAYGFAEIIFLTLSAQIFVIPVILHNFHSLSLVSLVANLLVLPVIPLSMFLVFVTAVAGLFSNLLAQPFAWLAYLPLRYEVWIVETLGNLSWSAYPVKEFAWPLFVFWYGIIIILLLFLKKKSNVRQKNNSRYFGSSRGA